MNKFGLILVLCANIAYADCHIRTNISVKRQPVNSAPTDVQKLVVPDTKGSKCIMRYRIHIGDNWKTAEGTGIAPTESKACAIAMESGNGMLLAEVEPKSVKSENQMVCSDFPDIRVHTVKIGDVIWESETDLHSIPAERPYFNYKRTQCRMFVERESNSQNLELYQGVICRLNATNGTSKWQVIDKY